MDSLLKYYLFGWLALTVVSVIQVQYILHLVLLTIPLDSVCISNEPSHEIMALFVLRKLILQVRMRSHLVGLDV